MAAKSAGLLPWRYQQGMLEVFLVHPGGPFYRKRDEGVWSVAKGEYVPGEDPLAAACREFAEEVGMPVSGSFLRLETVKQKGGKQVMAWAVMPDAELYFIASNTFSLEWPPRSGKLVSFPEVDQAKWMTIDEAVVKILPSQLPLLEELIEHTKREA